jgi:hypothetical protein
MLLAGEDIEVSQSVTRIRLRRRPEIASAINLVKAVTLKAILPYSHAAVGIRDTVVSLTIA